MKRRQWPPTVQCSAPVIHCCCTLPRCGVPADVLQPGRAHAGSRRVLGRGPIYGPVRTEDNTQLERLRVKGSVYDIGVYVFDQVYL
jgi:hypothetical protein